jgi:hypothetical protein
VLTSLFTMDLMDLDPVTTDALYAPLVGSDAFRLMVLQPGQRHEPVVVQLGAVSAHSVPEYDALSYVWGDPRETIRITCNALPVNITANLHAALVQVRSPHAPRILWADALCINQQDKRERGQQVTIMGSIYANARFVLVCMGESADHGGVRISALLRDYIPVVNDMAPPTDDPRWGCLGSLLRKDWFGRVWVLQEVGLAKNPRVVYDGVDFCYRQLMAAVKWVTIRAPDFAARAGIRHLLIHTFWTDWSEKWDSDIYIRQCALLDLLDHASLLECQDPRDHIYAFLGHPLARVAGGVGRAITPDYRKGVMEVYKEASVALLAESGIRTLSSAEHNDETLDDFETPSWVVRWNVQYIVNNIHLHPSTPYQACGSRSQQQMTLQEDVLHILGVKVDTVKEVYRMEHHEDSLGITFTNVSTGQTGTLQDLLSYLSTPSTPYAYTKPHQLVLALALCIERVRGEDRTDFVESWNAFMNWNRSGQLVFNFFQTPSYRVLAEKFWNRMMNGCEGRAFVLTEHGRYGLAPQCSRPGDVCCVFDGAFVPFILRPVQTGSVPLQKTGEFNVAGQKKGEFRFVGEAYLYGIMQGESVGFLQRGEAVEQVFRIF